MSGTFAIEILEEKTKYVLPVSKALNFGLFKNLIEITNNEQVVIDVSKQYMDIIIKLIEQNDTLPIIEKHNRNIVGRYMALLENDRKIIEKMSFDELTKDNGFIYTCNKLDIEYPALLACMYITTKYDESRMNITLLEDKIIAVSKFANKEKYINYQIWNQLEYFMKSNYELYKNLNIDYEPITGIECSGEEMRKILKAKEKIKITKLYCEHYDNSSLYEIKDLPLKILNIPNFQGDSYYISYLTDLEEYYTKNDNASIDCLEKAQKLEILSICIYNNNIYTFDKLMNLRKLCIFSNGPIGFKCLSYILQNCNKLETIYLSEVGTKMFYELFNYDNIKNILISTSYRDIVKKDYDEKYSKKKLYVANAYFKWCEILNHDFNIQCIDTFNNLEKKFNEL
jgi:hypothetical protein